MRGDGPMIGGVCISILETYTGIKSYHRGVVYEKGAPKNRNASPIKYLYISKYSKLNDTK